MRPHSYVTMVLADKPFLYLRLNEQTGFGTIAYDASGNGNNGVYTGNVKREVDSPLGEGDLAIETTNNSHVKSSIDLTALTGPFSYEFWCKPTVIPTAIEYSVLLGFGVDETNFSIHVTTARLSYSFNIVASYEVEGFFTSGVWAHIVGVWDEAQVVKLYKDGVLLIASLPIAGPLQLGNGGHYIGRWGGGLQYPWEGGIDEVAFYDYGLTETQVKSHYLQGNLTSLFKRARKAA